MEHRLGGAEVNRRFLNWAFTIGAAAFVLGCGKDEKPMAPQEKPANVADFATKVAVPSVNFEIDFREALLPPYLITAGLGAAESWGRWSIADKVVFKFGSILPTRFAFIINAKAYGPNAGLAIPVRAGIQTKDMIIGADSASVVRLEFSPDGGTDTIEIQVPKPTIPTNGDVRSLGIAIFSLKIEAIK